MSSSANNYYGRAFSILTAWRTIRYSVLFGYPAAACLSTAIPIHQINTMPTHFYIYWTDAPLRLLNKCHMSGSAEQKNHCPKMLWHLFEKIWKIIIMLFMLVINAMVTVHTSLHYYVAMQAITRATSALSMHPGLTVVVLDSDNNYIRTQFQTLISGGSSEC